MKKTLILSLFISVPAWLWGHSIAAHPEYLVGGSQGLAPPVYFVIPFIAILLCIAILPLVNENCGE